MSTDIWDGRIFRSGCHIVVLEWFTGICLGVKIVHPRVSKSIRTHMKMSDTGYIQDSHSTVTIDQSKYGAMNMEYYTGWQKSYIPLYTSVSPHIAFIKPLAIYIAQWYVLVQYNPLHMMECSTVQYRIQYINTCHTILHMGCLDKHGSGRRWNGFGSKYTRLPYNAVPPGISTQGCVVCSWTLRNTRSCFRWHVFANAISEHTK